MDHSYFLLNLWTQVTALEGNYDTDDLKSWDLVSTSYRVLRVPGLYREKDHQVLEHTLNITKNPHSNLVLSYSNQFASPTMTAGQ